MNLKNIHKAIDEVAAAYVACHDPLDLLVRARAAEAVAYLKTWTAREWRGPTTPGIAFDIRICRLERGDPRIGRLDLADPVRAAEAQARATARQAARDAEAKEKRDRQAAARQKAVMASLPVAAMAFARTAVEVKQMQKGLVDKVAQLTEAVDAVPPEVVDRLVAELGAAVVALSAATDALKQKGRT
jgi:hypothetical protein